MNLHSDDQRCNNHNLNHNYPEHSKKKKKKKKTREQTKRSRKNTIKRNKLYVEDYKRHHPCSCGENDPCCLTFHHKNGDKVGNISDMANRAYSIKRIESEINKCTVMCLNCHTKLHNREDDDKHK